jgi:queuine/archaeosine tRNA-ribosyltransferase
MTSKLSFKIENINPLGMRTGRLAFSGERAEDILTPVRAFTNSDRSNFDKLKQIGLFKSGFDELSNLPFAINYSYNTEQLAALHNGNASQNHLRQLKKQVTDGKLNIFDPAISRNEKSRLVVIPEKTNNVLMDIQLQAGFKVITVLDEKPSSTAEEFKGRLNDARALLQTYEETQKDEEKQHLELFPRIDLAMRTDKFIAKINAINELGIKGVILKFASVIDNIENYRYLKKIAENNLFIHLSEVPRTFPKNDIYVMLALVLSGADSFSLQSRFRIDKDDIKAIMHKPIKRLDPNTWKFRQFDSLYSSDEKIQCCAVDKDYTKTEFRKAYNGAQLFITANRMHDSLVTNMELLKCRQETIQGSLKSHLQKKADAAKLMERVFKVAILSNPLSN